MRQKVTLASWDELAKKQYSKVQFLIDPYIPRNSIIFLWAKSSVGKSPLGWAMASAVGAGTNFFGLPVTNGRVLYIEVDTPEEVVVPLRLKHLPPVSNVWWMFCQPLGLPSIDKEVEDTLKEAQADIQPDLVILNTLRKLHAMDDKDSKTPTAVYSYFQHIFPQAALLFVHHEKKESQDPRALKLEGESFSGSRHWIDDAQVGLHLEKYSGKGMCNLRLHMRKSQVSELVRPLPLYLEKDGSNISSPLFNELLFIYEKIHEDPSIPRGDLDKLVAKHLGVSEMTARRRRAVIESGDFPGSRRFLARTEEESDESAI